MQDGTVRPHGQDLHFGRAVWAFHEDGSGTLWAAAESGLWRIKPGSARQYRTPSELIGLNRTDDGHLLVATHEGGLLRLAGDKLDSYAVQDARNPDQPMRNSDVDANRVVRDRDGGLWIGTVDRGLIHVHQGRTDLFTRADGLSGNIILSVFEDREGAIWVSTTGGLDRFRELPVTTVSKKQGLSSDATQTVLAATDGSVWISSLDGLSQWKKGRTTVFRRANGLPDDDVQSLFQDADG